MAVRVRSKGFSRSGITTSPQTRAEDGAEQGRRWFGATALAVYWQTANR